VKDWLTRNHEDDNKGDDAADFGGYNSATKVGGGARQAAMAQPIIDVDCDAVSKEEDRFTPPQFPFSEGAAGARKEVVNEEVVEGGVEGAEEEEEERDHIASFLAMVNDLSDETYANEDCRQDSVKGGIQGRDQGSAHEEADDTPVSKIVIERQSDDEQLSFRGRGVGTSDEKQGGARVGARGGALRRRDHHLARDSFRRRSSLGSPNIALSGHVTGTATSAGNRYNTDVIGADAGNDNNSFRKFASADTRKKAAPRLGRSNGTTRGSGIRASFNAVSMMNLLNGSAH
jgi:hypothetical protein